MRRKSLAEQLAELATPAPREEYDPLDDMNDEANAIASDDELDAIAAQRKGPERARMRADIVLADAEYRGRKSSRKAIFDELRPPNGGESNSEASASEGNSDGEEPQLGNAHGEASSEDDIDDLELDLDRRGDSGSSLSEDGSELSNGGGGTDDEDADVARRGRYADVQAGTVDAEEEDEMAALEREYTAMQAADANATTAAAVAARSEAELAKAKAVVNQKHLWERVLGMRIMLQRSLTASHRLPSEEARAAVRAHSEPVKAAYESCADVCRAALRDLLDVQSMLLDRHPGVSEAAEAVGVTLGKRKRSTEGSTDDLWSEIDVLEQSFAPFRDSALDRWHRKTMLATGKTAMKSQLKALNQSLSQQVAIMMRDPTRAVARTQLPLATRPRPLCESQPRATAPDADESDGSEPTREQGGARLGGASVDLQRGSDPHTYDDSDFHQLLLKEFLESANLDGAALSAMRGAKVRKVVDRRASKGRKIRYHVLDKLVNFMAPTMSQNDEMIQNIFSNLFGRGVTT